MQNAKVCMIKDKGEPYVKVSDLIELLNEVIIEPDRPTEEKRLAIELKADFVSMRKHK